MVVQRSYVNLLAPNPPLHGQERLPDFFAALANGATMKRMASSQGRRNKGLAVTPSARTGSDRGRSVAQR